MLREAPFSYFLLILVGTTALKCPETRKPHPTNCTLFYNCVNLPSGGYVWTPSKCSEGLVFESYLGICVLPSETWVCDTHSQATIVKENQGELIKSYLDFTSEPLDLSETLDSSYSLDAASDKEINPMTPNSLNREFLLNKNIDLINRGIENSADKLIEQDSFHQFENKTVVNSIMWFGRIITNLLIYQRVKSPFETNSGFPDIRTKYLTQNSDNQENVLLNHFVTNYIIKNKKNQSWKEIGTRNITNGISQVKVKPVIYHLNQSTNGLMNNESNIEIINILDKKIQNENFETNSQKTESENASLLKKNLCKTIGNIADPNSSSHYYLCYSNNGKTTNLASVRMMCPKNLIFCFEKKICTRKRLCTKKRAE